MVDAEDLYHGKGRQTGVTGLSDGRKLPIWFFAWDPYQRRSIVKLGCLLVSKSDADNGIIKFHTCFITRPKCWCTTDELGESWAVKIDRIEKGYIQVSELRGID